MALAYNIHLVVWNKFFVLMKEKGFLLYCAWNVFATKHI